MQPKKSLSNLQKKVLLALADGGVLYVVTEYLRKTKVMMCRRGVEYFNVNKNTFNYFKKFYLKKMINQVKNLTNYFL